MLYTRKSKQKLKYLTVFGLSIAISACAPYEPNGDPYEKYNRAVFQMNTRLDTHIMKPVATFYNKAIPRPLNKGVNNFFTNISMVPTVVNDLLQGGFKQAGKDTTRLGINTTVGIVGLFDVASPMGLADHEETFGLTLAKWGWKGSNYIVLPFLGPSTGRDAIGKGVDWLIEYPIYNIIQDRYTRWGLIGLSFVNQRAQLLKYQDLMAQASLDPYQFQKNAYLQHQNYLISLNNPSAPNTHNTPNSSTAVRTDNNTSSHTTSSDDDYISE